MTYKEWLQLPKDDRGFEQQFEQWAQCESCGKEFRYISQEDDHAEYMTELTIVCDCGTLVRLKDIPVN